MQKKRLLKLADLLETDAKTKKGIKFNLRVWGHVGDPAAPMSCGTSACAMGLAALSGIFRKQGLVAEYAAPGNNFPRSLGITFEDPKTGVCTYGGFSAAGQLFGITERESRYLFDPSSYSKALHKHARGELAVARRIRKFVGGKFENNFEEWKVIRA